MNRWKLAGRRSPSQPLASTLKMSAFVATAMCLTGLASAQDASQIQGLQWRNIGPFRGGRVSAVTGAVGQTGTFYIGMPQGGIFKTTGAGSTWYEVADSIKDVCCFGSVQVAPSDPNVVYAGTGEAIGGEGNGVYKSTDGGKTWAHQGLEETQQIPALLVDPKDSNIAILAAKGIDRKLTKQRGVFRTTDGGKTWTNTLFIDEQTGVQHIAWAYDNPSVIYAASARHYQQAPAAPGTTAPPLSSLVPMLYKSTDEGATWTKLEPTGLPKLVGRVCLAVAQHTNSQRVYLIGTFGLYRSDDGGATWRQMAKDDNRIANGQGNYTSGVYVDSKNPDIIYTLATCVYRSLDGGNTFEGFKGAPGGDDPQQMWIDPTDGNRMLLGGDQGAVVTNDGGLTWGSWYNQPTAQVYHINTDNQYPYWIYATQQDSGVTATRSRGNLGALTPIDWYPSAGFEFGTVVPDPINPNISYCLGPNLSILKVTYPSGQWIELGPDLNPDSDLRAGIGLPLIFSPVNRKELFAGYNHLMSTTDGGVHWNQISPDLSLKTGQKATASGRFGGSIDTLSPSSIDGGIIWTASGNGVVYVTKDHGKNWTEVSLTNLSKRSRVSCIEASHTDPAAAYLSMQDNDRMPHCYRTRDFGKTWKEIVTGLPGDQVQGSSTLVIRADTKRDGLLFVGTDSGMYVSFNDGDSWQSLMLNLPVTTYNDIQVKDNDLVVGTYGRGLWILDDYSPLREITPATLAESAHLYKPGEAIRVRRNVNLDTPFPVEVPHADNPPLGAVIYYSLGAKPSSDIKIEISDSSGKVVRHMSSAPIAPYDDPPTAVPPFWAEVRKPMATELGLNRINWNIRYDTPPAFVHDEQDVMGAMKGDTPQAIEGPLALPGDYTVKLMVDGKTYTQTVTVKNDPRSPASSSDLKAQHELQKGYYDGVQEAYDGYQQAVAMRGALASIMNSKPTDAVAKAAKDLDDKISVIAGTVRRGRRFFGPPPATSFVNIDGFLLAQLDSLDMGDMAPTDSMRFAYASAWVKLKAMADRWREINTKDLVEFNALLTKNAMKPISAAWPTLQEPIAPAAKFMPKVDKAKGTTPKGNIDPEELERMSRGDGDGDGD